jgi:hypothetical protein
MGCPCNLAPCELLYIWGDPVIVAIHEAFGRELCNSTLWVVGPCGLR